MNLCLAKDDRVTGFVTVDRAGKQGQGQQREC